MPNRLPDLTDDEQSYLDTLRQTSHSIPFRRIFAVSMPHPDGRAVGDADPGRVVEFQDGPYEFLGATMSLGLPLFERLAGIPVEVSELVRHNVMIESNREAQR